jgi:hypothetical protein
MLGRRARGHLELFVCGSLRDLVPDDHALARVDRVLDLGWLHAEVSGLYAREGRPGIDPEAAVRLMLAGLSASSTTGGSCARRRSIWRSAGSPGTACRNGCPIIPR